MSSESQIACECWTEKSHNILNWRLYLVRWVNGKQWTQHLKCEAFTITAATSPPQLAPYAPKVFGLHPASNGISRGLMEAGRQLHQGAGSLAWEQGVAGLRGIGSCLGVLACWELRFALTMYTMGAPKPFGRLNVGSWGVGVWKWQGGCQTGTATWRTGS